MSAPVTFCQAASGNAPQLLRTTSVSRTIYPSRKPSTSPGVPRLARAALVDTAGVSATTSSDVITNGDDYTFAPPNGGHCQHGGKRAPPNVYGLNPRGGRRIGSWQAGIAVGCLFTLGLLTFAPQLASFGIASSAKWSTPASASAPSPAAAPGSDAGVDAETSFTEPGHAESPARPEIAEMLGPRTFRDRLRQPQTTEVISRAVAEGDGDDGEAFLPPEELGEDVLADGKARCWTDGEGNSRCLPTVFFFGVSKCGTTSLSTWLAEHPRTVFVSPPAGHEFREAHVFDSPRNPWDRGNTQVRRERLAPVAEPWDTVIDFTPNYSVVGEAPLRISDFYEAPGAGEGRLRRNLRFFVLLREPVARTISSWIYKSEPAETSSQTAELRRNGTVFDDHTFTADGKFTVNVEGEWGHTAVPTEESRRGLVEHRPLLGAFREGTFRVARLLGCVRNATDTGLFGREPTVTYCRTTKGKQQCDGHPPCELCNTYVKPWCDPTDYLEEVIYNAHVGKSMYAMQLRRWFSIFGRKSFKVVFAEDMEEDPVKILGEVLDFIGLDLVDPQGDQGLRTLEQWREIVGARYNTADSAKKEVLDSQVTSELRAQMQAFFAPHNKDLEDLLGVPLPKSWHVER